MQAFQNLEKLRLHLPDDFDYEKELEESRKFKYGSINWYKCNHGWSRY